MLGGRRAVRAAAVLLLRPVRPRPGVLRPARPGRRARDPRRRSTTRASRRSGSAPTGTRQRRDARQRLGARSTSMRALVESDARVDRRAARVRTARPVMLYPRRAMTHAAGRTETSQALLDGAARGRRRARRRRRRAARAAAARRAPRARPAARAAGGVSRGEVDDLAAQAADDALAAILGQARHLPRREPLHDLGVQVRPARGGREGAPPRLARPRGRRSRTSPGAVSPTRGPSAQESVEQAELLRAIATAMRDRADAAPARDLHRARAQRRPDRRARRAARRPPAARSTRRSTTRGASSVPRSPRPDYSQEAGHDALTLIAP